MKFLRRFNLQLFAEGGDGGASSGDGAAGEAATGANATADAEQRLRELGGPEDRIRKRASKVALRMPAVPTKTEAAEVKEEAKEQTAPAEDNPTEEKTEKPTRMSWDEIMADPEYNEKMQSVVKSRLRTAKDAEENLAKLAPAMEMLARKYKLDPNNMDYDALTKAISADDSYFEEKALEMGVPVETARKLDEWERDKERQKARAEEQKAQEERTLQEQMISQHFAKLEEQGKELQKIFPGFDLRRELQNPAFARMTAPGKGIMSVEDAYRAVHRKEIDAATSQAIAQTTAQKISNAIQSGSRRPNESGTSSQAPSVTTFDYRNASKDQREAFKKRIREAAARGEKLYPGQ